MQLVIIYVLVRVDPSARFIAILLPAAHLILLPFILKNLSLWGVRLLGVGLLLNLSVMVSNGGLMPVGIDGVEAVGRHEPAQLSPGAYIPGTKNVYAGNSHGNLGFLGDSIILPVPRPFTRAVSIGDLFIAGGITIAAIELATLGASYRMRRQGHGAIQG